MMTGLLLLVLAIGPQQQLENEVQRQRQQLDQLEGQLRQQVGRLERMIDEQEQRLQPRPVCQAEVRWVGTTDSRAVPSNPSSLIFLNLFSTVSRPAEGCLPAEVRVSASYLDSSENLICSGVVENAAIQAALVQSVNLQIRPWNLAEFVRWRNEPPQTNSGFKRLSCMDPEGLAEANAEELARVYSLRLRATVLPAGGGASTAEVVIRLQR